MTKPSAHLVDLWGPLTYKPAFAQQAPTLLAATTWMPEEHRRRLRAYTLLGLYLKNMSRELLDGEKVRKNRREYGDPSLIVETIVAAILGEETTIVVDGAGEMTEPTADGAEPAPANPDADALQAWFEQWDDDEKLMLAVTEGETDAVGLGDGVWEVSWDGAKERPRVTVYDPGMYFPVLDTMEQSNADFPTRVHVAWEYERWEVQPSTQTRVPVKYVRRITWDLRDLPIGETRTHPWSRKPATVTCYKTDATWRFDDIGTRTAEDFDMRPNRGAVFATTADGEEIRDLDLNIDFLPVVHLPNTIARKEHFGLSSLALVLQILDDLQAADTDLALASRTTGSPPLWGKNGFAKTGADGEEHQVTTYGPGQLFDGEVGLVDTSKALDALLKYVEFLLRRLSSNTQLPEASLGRTDPSKVDAGVIMSLSFGPLARMIKKMRLVREEKYPLLLKMVARHQLQYGQNDGLQVSNAQKMPKVRLAFGRFMPLDRAAVTEMVAKLFEAKLISRLMAVKILIEEAGLAIEEAHTEVERIEHEDFEGAGLLADAGDDINDARRYLGLRELPADQTRPEPPELNIPNPVTGEQDGA